MKPVLKLYLSVLFGWGVIIYFAINAAVQQGESGVQSLILAAIFLSLRYSVFKPINLIGSVLSGWLMLNLWDYLLTGRFNQGSPMVAYVLIVIVLAFSLAKGATLSAYFLSVETQLGCYHLNQKTRSKIRNFSESNRRSIV